MRITYIKVGLKALAEMQGKSYYKDKHLGLIIREVAGEQPYFPRGGGGVYDAEIKSKCMS